MMRNSMTCLLNKGLHGSSISAAGHGGEGRGAQFERLIGVMKQSLHKSIGNGNLRWHKLEEVIVDVETILNNRPLGYVEDDVQIPVLTPSAILYGQPNQLPEEEAEAIEDVNLRKRAKYLKQSKDVLRSKWNTSYLKALRERQNLNRRTGEANVNPGDVVLIKGEECNRGRWRFGIVEQLIQGRNGVVRGARLRAGEVVLRATSAEFVTSRVVLRPTCLGQRRDPKRLNT